MSEILKDTQIKIPQRPEKEPGEVKVITPKAPTKPTAPLTTPKPQVNPNPKANIR